MRKRRLAFLLCALLLAVLAGCAAEQAEVTQPTTTAPPVYYTVRFYSQGQVIYEEQVEEGALLQQVPTKVPPYHVIGGWLDARGNLTDPHTAQVMGDLDYTAVLYPAFTNHLPYLFPDELGRIRPDDVLTGAELAKAMEVLAADKEMLQELAFPEPEAPVTKDALAALLYGLFPTNKLENTLRAAAEGEITRADYARIMNTLLDRQSGELLIVKNGQALPWDLDLHCTDAKDILEAALTHAVSAKGFEIMEAVMEMKWQPGFSNLGGWLYYADETGVLLRDGELGTMTFGLDGCYTSGDAELDAIVAELLTGIIAEKPQGARTDWLYTAFRYCRNSFSYVNRGLLEFGETGWEAEKAKQMFQTGAGNCYSFAAAFWALARGLGYDAQGVSGRVLEQARPHGWVEFEMDGLRYIFDPELAFADMIGERDNWGEDMYKIPPGDWHSWLYVRP